MSHPRTKVRLAAHAALAGITEFSGHVYLARTRLWAPSELPGLTVYTHNEETGERANPLRVMDLKLQTDIVLRCPPGVDVDTEIDDLALVVERTLVADLALRAIILDLYLESTDIEIDGSGDQAIVTAQIVWSVTYQVDTEDLENFPN